MTLSARLSAGETVFTALDDFARANALDWDGVRALHAEGVVIGSHSVSHPDFATLSADAARSELHRSRERLMEQLGVEVDAFAIPFGQSANWTAALTELAREVGYVHVYAQSCDRRPPGTVGRTFITKFDDSRRFRAAINGAFDGWEEWSW